jgi:hypothetical protein
MYRIYKDINHLFIHCNMFTTVGFEVFTAVVIKIFIFWDITLHVHNG